MRTLNAVKIVSVALIALGALGFVLTR